MAWIQKEQRSFGFSKHIQYDKVQGETPQHLEPKQKPVRKSKLLKN